MGFYYLLQYVNILNLIWLSCFLQNIESIPFSNLTSLIPGATNSSALSEYFKLITDESREVKNKELSLASNNQQEGISTESTDFFETNASKKRLRKNLLTSLVVPYVCDIERKMCWLNQNQEHLATFFIPIKLLPNKQPPAEIGLKEFYSLVTKKQQQLDSLDSYHLNLTDTDQQPSSDVHRRRKRDTQYSEANDNYQQEWENQENQGDQSSRAQRDVPSTSTEHNPTSTVGRAQRNVDPQTKQLKRSAEMDDDEVEDDDFGSPSPDDDYQQEDDGNYKPEKRFAGPETAGTTPLYSDFSTRSPSQPSRREVMHPNYNYPLFANPDFYYPSQRLLSPFDGINYRSVDAMPMQFMYANPGFWQDKIARNPRQYYAQRQAGGYARGWPPAPSYYQSYANRYQSPYPTPPAQQNAGYIRHHHRPQQSSYSAYKPYSYSYAQGNKPPVRKPIETDADMYYGK